MPQNGFNDNILTADKAEQNVSPTPRKGLKYDGIVGDIEKRLCYIGLKALRKLRFLKRRAVLLLMLLLMLLLFGLVA